MIDYQSQFYPFIILSIEFISFIQHQSLAHIHVYHYPLTPTLVSMYPLSINPYPRTPYVFHSHYSLTPTLISMYPYPHTPYVFHSHCLLTPTLVLDLSSILLVTYREEVPTGGPPSFHGRLVRYTYKLTVGAQKPNCPAQIVRIPIRIITIPGNYVCMYVCMYVYVMYVCIYVCRMYMYVYVCRMYVHVCMQFCMYICMMYVYYNIVCIIQLYYNNLCPFCFSSSSAPSSYISSK